MKTYLLRVEVGRDNVNWAGYVESEYREQRDECVAASTKGAAIRKLGRQLEARGWRLVRVMGDNQCQ